MGGIDHDGGQDRFELLSPVGVDEFKVLALELVGLPEVDALGGQSREQVFIPAAILFGDLGVGAFVDARQLLRGGQAIGTAGIGAGFAQLQQTGDSYFVEFVEVAGDDGHELDAFE